MDWCFFINPEDNFGVIYIVNKSNEKTEPTISDFFPLSVALSYEQRHRSFKPIYTFYIYFTPLKLFKIGLTQDNKHWKCNIKVVIFPHLLRKCIDCTLSFLFFFFWKKMLGKKTWKWFQQMCEDKSLLQEFGLAVIGFIVVVRLIFRAATNIYFLYWFRPPSFFQLIYKAVYQMAENGDKCPSWHLKPKVTWHMDCFVCTRPIHINSCPPFPVSTQLLFRKPLVPQHDWKSWREHHLNFWMCPTLSLHPPVWSPSPAIPVCFVQLFSHFTLKMNECGLRCQSVWIHWGSDIKDIQFSIMYNKEKQQIVHNKEAGNNECLAILLQKKKITQMIKQLRK